MLNTRFYTFLKYNYSDPLKNIPVNIGDSRNFLGVDEEMRHLYDQGSVAHDAANELKRC